MSKCEGINVDITIPVSINDDIDMHNTSSDYYNNKCSKGTSKHGTDITLNDRKNEFINNNMTLCEEDCDLIDYNKITEKVKCSCKIKLNLPIIQTVKFDKSKLLQHFIDINKIFNIEILKCYKSVFKFKNLIKNFGFYFYSLMLFIYLITLFIFCLKSYSTLKKSAKKLVKDIKSKISQNQQDLKKSKNDGNKSKKSINKNENKILNKKKSKRKRRKANNNKKDKANKNNKLIDNENKNKHKSKKNKNKVKKKEKISFENLNIKDSLNNQYKLNNYNNSELNNLDYKEALLYDKRTYFQYYFSLLKQEHILIFSFYCNSNDYNSQIIKIFLFFFFFSVHFFVNALFFDDDTIHRIFEDKGDFNFIYQIPQIIYSSLISEVINIIIKFLSLSENDILKVKGLKEIKILKSEFKKLFRILSIKFTFFLLLLFCCL